MEALTGFPILRELQEALASRDAERAASFYSEDALFVTSGRPPAEGRAAAQRVFEEDFGAPGFKLDLAVERVEVAASGDMAVVRGAFRVSFSPSGDGTPVEVRGAYLQVLRRPAKQPWRVTIDISTPTGNVSSGAGAFALPLISLYTSTKFALEGFSESLSSELADLGIQVKIVEPGGVTGTGFIRRSGSEAALLDGLSDYLPFVDGANRVFRDLARARTGATSEEVAEAVFRAATDGTNQLRYVATEDIKPMIAMRRETSEAEYMAYMRERFAPRSPAVSSGRE